MRSIEMSSFFFFLDSIFLERMVSNFGKKILNNSSNLL